MTMRKHAGKEELQQPQKIRERGDRTYNIICGVIFTLFALICIFPFYYMFSLSVSDNYLVSIGAVFLYPKGIHFQNYIDLFKQADMLSALGVTLARTFLGTFLTVGSSMWLGYCFSKSEYWGKKFWYRFVIITMYFNAGLIPNYLNVQNLGLMNTFWVYVFGFVSAYNVILCKTFIESLPAALEESAQIDGAGYFTRFTKIVLPLSMPIIATITVFTAVGHWSNYMDTVLYVKDENLRTLQYVLYEYINKSTAIAEQMKKGAGSMADLSKAITPISLRMTVTMVVTLPVIFVYPFFQRYYVKGVMIGAVKG